MNKYEIPATLKEVVYLKIEATSLSEAVAKVNSDEYEVIYYLLDYEYPNEQY